MTSPFCYCLNLFYKTPQRNSHSLLFFQSTLISLPNTSLSHYIILSYAFVCIPYKSITCFCVLVSLAPKTMNAYEFVLSWFSLKYPDFKFRLHFLGHPEHTMRRQHLETGFCAFFPFNYSEHAAGRVNHTAQLWWMASAVSRALWSSRYFSECLAYGGCLTNIWGLNELMKTVDVMTIISHWIYFWNFY